MKVWLVSSSYSRIGMLKWRQAYLTVRTLQSSKACLAAKKTPIRSSRRSVSSSTIRCTMSVRSNPTSLSSKMPRCLNRVLCLITVAITVRKKLNGTVVKCLRSTKCSRQWWNQEKLRWVTLMSRLVSSRKTLLPTSILLTETQSSSCLQRMALAKLSVSLGVLRRNVFALKWLNASKLSREWINWLRSLKNYRKRLWLLVSLRISPKTAFLSKLELLSCKS